MRIFLHFIATPSFSDTVLLTEIELTGLPSGCTHLLRIERAFYQSFFPSEETGTTEKCLGADTIEIEHPLSVLSFPLTISKPLDFAFPKIGGRYSFVPQKILALEEMLWQESAEYRMEIKVITDTENFAAEFPVLFG